MHQSHEQEPNLSFLLRKQDSNKKCCFYLCQNKAHCRTLILIFGRLVSSIKEAQTYRSQREMVISNSTTPPTYLCIKVQQIMGFLKSSLFQESPTLDSGIGVHLFSCGFFSKHYRFTKGPMFINFGDFYQALQMIFSSLIDLFPHKFAHLVSSCFFYSFEQKWAISILRINVVLKFPHES